MSVTGSIVGRETVAYFKQGTTWGTEATGGAGMKLLEDGMAFTQNLDAVEENDSTHLKAFDLGTRTAGVNFRQALYFDDIRGIAFALGDGSYATPAEANAGKTDYTHTIYPADDNYGDFATIAFKKGAVIQSFPSVKIAGFTISGQASPQRLEVTYTGVADELLDASTVITATAFSALTTPSGNGGRAYFRNFDCWINDQSGATLATGDLVSNAVTSFEFAYMRSLASDYTNDSGLNIEEPVEDSYQEATLTLQMRNLDATYVAGWQADWVAMTPKKLKWAVTGAAASTATGTVAAAKFQVEAPKAIVTNVDFGSYTGPGRISGSVSFRLLGAETTGDAAGMAFLQPFKVTAINNQATEQVA